MAVKPSSYHLGIAIKDDMCAMGLRQNDVAKEMDMSPVRLNRLLNGDRSIPLKTLDVITEIIGKPAGYYYPQYLEDCLVVDVKRPKKRIQKFVTRTMELGLDELTQKAIHIMLNSGDYYENLLSVGEDLRKIGRKKEAMFILNMLTAESKGRPGRVIAMSYYRQLLVLLDEDLDKALEVAMKLCEYLPHVDEEERLEAHFKVVSTFRLNEKWDFVDTYGAKLVEIAKEAGRQDMVGDALIKRGIAARKKGEIPKALAIIDEYGKIGGLYATWAEGNRLIVLIDDGELDKIPELYRFMKKYPERSFEYVEYYLEVLIRHELFDSIKDFFEDFPHEVEHLDDLFDNFSRYGRHIATFMYAKATYFLKKGNYNDGLEHAIKAATTAADLRLHKLSMLNLKLIVEHIYKASEEQHKRCVEILELLSATDCFYKAV
ncbi:MAG TPA: helix-turn-helix transcriptional regulator [Chitinophagaceae bacterium]|nr:helix-turn-helix transcriptional regulator [Chitinophagaceae bacterium]